MTILTKRPFNVEISRVIEVLATQIYQSPLALLRENTQNSYDAILLRRAKEEFDPKIEISITATQISVHDNGIGMTPEELDKHYWRAGSSSKNTAEARAAGVVGTFGIGAMANFGIAEELIVETESVNSGQRTRCHAIRSTLSATEDCISYETLTPQGKPGTTVTATVQSGKTIDVAQASVYIREFVMFLPIHVTLNGALISKQPYTTVMNPLPEAWAEEHLQVDLGAGLHADVRISGASNGEVQTSLVNVKVGDREMPGAMLLRQSGGALRTFRSGFGLANTAVHSVYQFGGVADFLFLEPTAGREALTTASMQLLQDWMSKIDSFVSQRFGLRPESDASTFFMNWVNQHGAYHLCQNLKVNISPGKPVTLREVEERSKLTPFLIYGGADPATLAHASEDRPLIVLARSNPRRQCEAAYLRSRCAIEELTDAPKITKAKPESQWSRAESALAFRLVNILSSDYFVAAKICYGDISHGLPILVTKESEPIEIWLAPQGQSTNLLLSLYDNQYMAFDGMAKDFVRNVIFQRIANLVPSSTRQGAEAFLKSIQRNREVFEYEFTDLDSLASIWGEYTEGKITMEQAALRSSTVAAKTVQVIDSTASASVRDVLPDVIENAASLQPAAGGLQENAQDFDATPPIQRISIETERKLLTIPEGEQALQGFRCFLALTDRVREDRGDFFLQPHKTSIVWGGQRVLFVFEHHSGKFGLYYDVQSQELISPTSGGRSFPTCTIILKNRIFIPIPTEIQAAFIPKMNDKKRLQVKCDILYID
jgi:molecular chaperone HtpG